MKILMIVLSLCLLSSTDFKAPEILEIPYEGLQWPVQSSFITGVDQGDFLILEEYRDAERAIHRELRSVRQHPLMQDPEARVKLARNIVNAASMIGVPWEAVFTIARYESTFFPDVWGTDGLPSVGLMQMHGVAWPYCAKQIGRKIDKFSPEDQLICGSVWLRYSMDECGGDLAKGLAKYATGHLCGYARVPAVVELVEKRMRLYYETVDRGSEI